MAIFSAYKIDYLINETGIICGADDWEAIKEESKNKLKLLKNMVIFTKVFLLMTQ
ncbi:MAG: hypothetical protein ACI9VT_002699 [Psychroserpens sp.]